MIERRLLANSICGLVAFASIGLAGCGSDESTGEPAFDPRTQIVVSPRSLPSPPDEIAVEGVSIKRNTDVDFTSYGRYIHIGQIDAPSGQHLDILYDIENNDLLYGCLRGPKGPWVQNEPCPPLA